MMSKVMLSVIYGKDKRMYYECLRVYDQKQILQPMMKYLEFCHTKTWEKKKRECRKLMSFL